MSFRACDHRALIDQIGRLNILAISGGRVWMRPTGITLPVSSGYYVKVDLAGDDTYTVQRVFWRGDREFDHGTQAGVYCEDVGEGRISGELLSQRRVR